MKPFNCFSHFYGLTTKAIYEHLECLGMHSQVHGGQMSLICDICVLGMYYLIPAYHMHSLIPLSFISSMCSLCVSFTITESQQDDNCFKHLTTDVNTNTCIIIAKIIMKFKLQVERAPLGRDPCLCGKVIQTLHF